MVGEPLTGVEITLDYPLLAFVYGWCSVYAVIDGTVIRAIWGKQFYPTYPGRHSIGGYTNYLLFPQCGRNQIEVDIHPGQVVRVTWSAPHFTFSKGKIRVTG